MIISESSTFDADELVNQKYRCAMSLKATVECRLLGGYCQVPHGRPCSLNIYKVFSFFLLFWKASHDDSVAVLQPSFNIITYYYYYFLLKFLRIFSPFLDYSNEQLNCFFNSFLRRRVLWGLTVSSCLSAQNILEKFNPGARQLINAGKAYLKALHGEWLSFYSLKYQLAQS